MFLALYRSHNWPKLFFSRSHQITLTICKYLTDFTKLRISHEIAKIRIFPKVILGQNFIETNLIIARNVSLISDDGLFLSDFFANFGHLVKKVCWF